ncbi:nicotinate phosphoribosyltransferase [Paenibacillus radicis (ex Xue et al. 2023)]|uniref:Nicotinate phosphoribosyltransferase n=1 Tax=Paenibacillus radicis (ex Xue et al. 2023) TaxID=2972489 RepID=A0ABT1YBX9_9BACL|nr:nicotinate phosphoribosyltransferase [Paenibacillus radicis (ex Xue et al. 2023)]MCR8630692.1 nicotinate phosphoribosyltransferase [Paenibacillus radicis (ex Xue et al. 2023)]
MNYNNLTLHTDKYQINMMYAHWIHGTHDSQAVFEVFFRKLPFGNGYAVFAGVQRIVEYVNSLQFDDECIQYLREQEENYDPRFLEALREFRFTGHLHAVEEGTIVFPNEPLIRVEGRIFEAQLLETAILNFMNFQTLIATKASRIRQVAPDDILMEFGTRRAQEADAAVWGARAAYIAGFNATSNMRAGMLFGIPAKGTHAHSWVQDHDSEEESFYRYAAALPDQVTLLVDTYDTLKSGVPHAIQVAQTMEQQGKRMGGIRLDSGDLAYLSKTARTMLDDAGLSYVKIVASNDLDENIIFNLKSQGAQIDSWGVGTQLITAADQPALGGVYKLVAREKDGEMIPVIKISGNPEKVSTPGIKDVFRLISRETGKAEADYVALTGEPEVMMGERLKLYDKVHPYLYKYIEQYEAIPLLRPIFVNGQQVYRLPDLQQIREYHQQQMSLFWPEFLRKLNPAKYLVDFSTKAWELKIELIHKHTK